MKYFIASDIHGSAYYCEKMLKAFELEKADKLLLLGDILYHGPRNDLPKDYAPKKVISMLNEMADKILSVRGNCEAEVDQMVLTFPVMADYGVLCENERLIYFTHGHNHNISSPLPLAKGDILLHGHTHIPAWEIFGNENLYLNPGSVSIPKNDTAHGYMTLENGIFKWKDLDGNIYHELKI
ncbi:MAG: phosphodiesterase [Oscillospiraceae bacterium]|nr:phosphodiesterase [Oscillospiraceae bacterium]